MRFVFSGTFFTAFCCVQAFDISLYPHSFNLSTLHNKRRLSMITNTTTTERRKPGRIIICLGNGPDICFNFFSSFFGRIGTCW
ncbi:hypothetical protein J3E72DRAFT_327016 [Bipolaris maydis]|uniref:uncharacterized protein n=1 Tax=Cochliobolus heterostrophus TaxID=5016 RepID=UPI0024D0A59E|nr:hypothetical protein J3E73DRAFT_319762 [Bipolaris maydis]KAJ5064287.1 hypothetical protein J3E74DRAFT_311289 [Bipolaris maydis]KAJ6196566.1 hypothetical protein J3E72DRAFT_327016 [Bipolaris maydis]KAJ6207451.1 hypothetical protein PSV09DRAFT_2322036 [Bipolaris maydis]KAJ6269890.1 hypothetical protein PSV08DRAFT_310696 [Bipolaris maydis]